MTSDVVPASPTTSGQPPAAQGQRTIGDLLKRIDVAQGQMSRKNNHRTLLLELGHVVVELANRMTEADKRADVAEAEVARLNRVAELRASGA